jgi:hypothetical protein
MKEPAVRYFVMGSGSGNQRMIGRRPASRIATLFQEQRSDGRVT